MKHKIARRPSWSGRRAALPLIAGVTSVALLSACGAGQVTQTSDEIPAIQGVGTSAGHVTVDDAMILFPPRLQYPAGADAPLSLVITNGASTDDTLISAHSDAARAVEVTPAAPGTTPPARGCVLAPNLPEPAAEPGPAGDAADAAAKPLGRTGATLAESVPNGGMAIMTPNCPHLLLVGLKRPLTLLDTVPLQLTFAGAGTVDLVLPVQTSNKPLPRETIPGVDSPTGGSPTPDPRG
jgi:copper(I)-binding protein